MAIFERNYERMDERFNTFVDALTAAMSSRVVTRDLLHISDRETADLLKGIWTPISDEEGNYRNEAGMRAVEGEHRVLLVAHLAVQETNPPVTHAVQDMEFAMIEELKAFVRAGVPRMTVNLERVRTSRQLEYPRGWVYAELVLGPSPQGTH